MLNAQSRREGTASVVTVQGSLKYENLPTLRGAIQGVLAEQCPEVLVLNLEGVEFVDSSGISMLVALHHIMKSKQSALRLCCLSPHFNRILSVVNLCSFFSIFPVEDDALCVTEA